MGRKPSGRKNKGLGDRKPKILEFLVNFQDEHGYSPSIREIGRYINVDSTSLVDYYLEQLREEGFIERDKRVSRSIRVLKSLYGDVTQRVGELFSIPIWGRIGASLPVPMPPAEGSYFDPDSCPQPAPLSRKG